MEHLSRCSVDLTIAQRLDAVVDSVGTIEFGSWRSVDSKASCLLEEIILRALRSRERRDIVGVVRQPRAHGVVQR